ncbi:gamma-type small acid-soluble spore protein [Bacillus cereus]|uniref:gamma-type small acid-soluble spore protein n=1 Tax=Bacillus cereus TaxID=1396 RepID=UPI003820C89F
MNKNQFNKPNNHLGTEFASETDVHAVKKANAQPAKAGVHNPNAHFGTEFASETDVNAVKKANAQSTAHKLNPSNNQH